MTEISHEIRALNGLIANIVDSVDGFMVAAGETKDEHLGEIFQAHARDRGVVIRGLQAEVLRLGGNPEVQGTLLAGLHRNFVALKTAVARNNLRAILSEVERSEDRLKAKFDGVLADIRISAPVRAVIRTALAAVREGCRQMRNLEHTHAIAA
jgi:uncharacterized protein (TIGR02284 family)